MDWIQWLTIFYMILNSGAIFVYAAKQNMASTMGHFIGGVIMLPIYGRIIGWW
jgi:hypothetical protein